MLCFFQFWLWPQEIITLKPEDQTTVFIVYVLVLKIHCNIILSQHIQSPVCPFHVVLFNLLIQRMGFFIGIPQTVFGRKESETVCVGNTAIVFVEPTSLTACASSMKVVSLITQQSRFVTVHSLIAMNVQKNLDNCIALKGEVVCRWCTVSVFTINWDYWNHHEHSSYANTTTSYGFGLLHQFIPSFSVFNEICSVLRF